MLDGCIGLEHDEFLGTITRHLLGQDERTAMPANTGHAQGPLGRLGRTQELDQCDASLGADGEVKAKVEENTAQFGTITGDQLHGHGPTMPVPIGRGD